MHAALLGDDSEDVPLVVVEVGNKVMIGSRSNPGVEFDTIYDRQVSALGEFGQKAIARARVAIVGLGGLGSVVAQQLAYLGVSSFLLIDSDNVESSNLNRLAGALRDDVGKSKVQVAARIVKSIQPSAQVEAIHDDVMKSSVARGILATDFFFCCTDSHGSRAVLAQLAYQYLVPGIDSGVRIESSPEGVVTQVVGRVQMLSPGLACLACSNVLDAEAVRRDLLTVEQRRLDQYIVGVQVPQPAVISLNTTVAGLAVTMFLASMTSLPLVSRYQIVRFDAGQVRSVESVPDPECSICSSHGFFMRGDSWPSPGRK